MNGKHDEDLARADAVANEPPAAGGDARVAQALDEVRTALDSGREIDCGDLLSKYHDVAEPLTECLESLDLIDGLAAQLAAAVGSDLSDRERPENDARLPTCLGDYRLIRQIGGGGMGIVFEAEQVSLGRRVALKVLPFAAMLDKEYRQRFKNEARLAAMLDHPNIVAVYDVGVEQGVHFYAMQYIEGQSLAEVLDELRRRNKVATSRGGRPTPETPAAMPETPAENDVGCAMETKRLPNDLVSAPDRNDKWSYARIIAEYGVQIAEALAYAHRKGIVHRDIKPANLMLDAEGKVWITDFGLARLDRNGSLTTPGVVVGTLRYMSPEQALGLPEMIDGRSDIYSVGATLYELLTLQPVFSAQEPQRLLDQITSQVPTRLREIDEGLSPKLETVVLKALAKDPRDRYASAHELASDLTCFLECKPIEAKLPNLDELPAK